MLGGKRGGAIACNVLHLISPCLECSAPRAAVRDQMGTYDPVNHAYVQAPDPSYEAQKDREFQRNNGLGNSGGVAIRVDPMRASFNPILGECKPEAAAVAAAHRPRPASAPRATAATAAPSERPATPGRRPRMAQGDSWGSYNPISHHWNAPPSDARFHDQNVALNKKSGVSEARLGKTEAPRDQGVYNPILNTWVVPPANTRIIQGLSFAPASLFSQPNPAQPRT